MSKESDYEDGGFELDESVSIGPLSPARVAAVADSLLVGLVSPTAAEPEGKEDAELEAAAAAPPPAPAPPPEAPARLPAAPTVPAAEPSTPPAAEPPPALAPPAPATAEDGKDASEDEDAAAAAPTPAPVAPPSAPSAPAANAAAPADAPLPAAPTAADGGGAPPPAAPAPDAPAAPVPTVTAPALEAPTPPAGAPASEAPAPAVAPAEAPVAPAAASAPAVETPAAPAPVAPAPEALEARASAAAPAAPAASATHSPPPPPPPPPPALPAPAAAPPPSPPAAPPAAAAPPASALALTLPALASALAAQFGAPLGSGREAPGWRDDTARTGLLLLSLPEALARLSAGRARGVAPALERCLAAFLHVAGGGDVRSFSPGASGGSGGGAGGGDPARLPPARAPLVLQCLGVPAVSCGVAAVALGGASAVGAVTWAQFLGACGHLVPGCSGEGGGGSGEGGGGGGGGDGGSGGGGGTPPAPPPPAPSVAAASSYLSAHAPPSATIRALQCVLCAVADALGEGAGPGQWRLAGGGGGARPHALVAPLLRLRHGEELLRAAGWVREAAVAGDGGAVAVTWAVAPADSLAALPPASRAALDAAALELEAVVATLEGAAPLSATLRSARRRVFTMDAGAAAEWVCKLLDGVRCAGAFLNAVARAPGDPAGWRVPTSTPAYIEHLEKPLGGALAVAVM
jgi:hypothetical protein